MSEERKYPRFSLAYRIEHWIFVLSFTTLAITGLVQKYAGASLSKGIIGLFGNIENVRVLHRVAAVILMVEVVYHLGLVIYRLYVQRASPSMLPSLGDVRNAYQTIAYNLRLSKQKPQQGRYTFEEKFEYWAVVWGTVIMVITGFMLWNPIATTRFLPGEFVPAAKTAHGGEALLAVLAIIIWHMYHVHLRRFNRSMFTGHLSEEEMLEEHPLELADIKAGVARRPVDGQAMSRRKRVFWPVYGVVGALLLVGIYAFVTFEQTAITTLPPAEQVVVFAPFTPTPLPTALPTPTTGPAAGPVDEQAATWEGGIGLLFQQKCGACHGEATKLGGLDVSSYLSTLAGGASGLGITPGDASNSQVLIKQSAGNHPGQFSEAELALIQEWVEDGALEQ